MIIVIDGSHAVAGYEFEPFGGIISPITEPSRISHFRHHSYIYDQETGLYYLQSRYYNAKVGRFINADSYPSTGQGLLGNNMFAYCGNNPVKRVDTQGYFWDVVIDIISLGFSIAEVVENPDDPVAWLGVAADATSLFIPCVSGGGAAVRAATKVDDVVDVARAADRIDDTVDVAKVGWNLGDDITNVTKAGNAPSWSTVRQRYWKNEAYLNPDNYTASNLARMQRGRAPLVELDGTYYSMELHHIVPRHSGGSNAYSNLIQVTPWEHAAIDPYRHFVP